MEKDIAQGKIGSVGEYELDLKGEKLILQVKAGHNVGSVGVVLELDGPQFIDMLTSKVPGKVDDAVGGMLKAALFGK